ncbi:MAG: tryptophan synthase subunit alpha [bacterium]|nr:tryptophan synthase subunit alpha [bacterium]
MNKIDAQLKKIKSQNRIGLMTHIVVGYPDLATSKNLLKTMLEVGVDFIELQIPFSDPLADGPTLMVANQLAVQHNTSVRQSMELMAAVSLTTSTPILFMTYFNIVFNYGVARFCQEASQAGCSGLIVPDMPLDEERYEGFIEQAEKFDLYVIRTLAPSSTPKRLRLNAQLAKGFVYFAGRQATTGSQRELDNNLFSNIKKVKQYIDKPVAVGFGISKPEHIYELKNHAEIAVLGSKVVNIYHESASDMAIKNVKIFLQSLVDATH